MRAPLHLRQGRTSKTPPAGPLWRRLVAVGGALVVAVGLVAVTVPAASAADSTTNLDGVTAVGDVTAGGGRVFVAAGDRIVVTDSRGELTDALTDLSGAAGLAMTPDGTRLYAALKDSGRVLEIDTSTLSILRDLDVAPYPCPSNLSLGGSRLWVGYGCGPSDFGGIFSVDLSSPTPEPVLLQNYMYQAPLVAAAGGLLVTGEMGLSPARLTVYDVSGAAPAQRGQITGATIGGYNYSLANLTDLTITPDGSTVLGAFGAPNAVIGWNTGSLAQAGTYLTGLRGPNAVAVSPDAAHIAGGVAFAPSVSVFDADTAAVVRALDPGGDPVNRALTFSGADVFAVLHDRDTGQFSLWRMHGGTLPPSSVTLDAPSSAVALRPLTVSGRLTLADGAAPGAQQLLVTRRLPDGTSADLAPVTTAPDGTFTITDTSQQAGSVGYTVLWDGNSAYRWSTASVSVTVARYPSTLTLSGPATGVIGKELRFSGTMDNGQTLPSEQWITVLRTLSNRKGSVTIALEGAFPAADGSFHFVDTPTVGGQYTYTVEWYGDDVSSAAQASHQVVVRGGLG